MTALQRRAKLDQAYASNKAVRIVLDGTSQIIDGIVLHVQDQQGFYFHPLDSSESYLNIPFERIQDVEILDRSGASS